MRPVPPSGPDGSALAAPGAGHPRYERQLAAPPKAGAKRGGVARADSRHGGLLPVVARQASPSIPQPLQRGKYRRHKDPDGATPEQFRSDQWLT
jgi:hypothetical protein